MVSINTNLSSLLVQSNLANATKGLNTAIERMTTGFKINHAKDNAANYSIAANCTTKISAYSVAEENTLQALDMLTTASDSISIMEGYASRLRSLAIQAANNTNSSSSLVALNAEASSIITELYRIKDTTEYNGIKLLESVSDIPNGVGADTENLKSKNSTFIREIKRIDTSTMTKLSDVAEDAVISSGNYSISTAEELAKLASMSNNSQIKGGKYVLASDIDLSAYSTGEGFEVIAENGGFRGVLDGNGYVIRNLYINRPDKSNVALIGGAHGPVINLGLENVEIIGKGTVGGIVGQGQMNGLENCYVKGGSIKSTSIWGGTGGLAGDLSYTKVDSCWSDVEVSGANNVGGLVGSASVGVSNSYSLGNVSGKKNVGGIYGQSSYGTITNCFVEGNIEALDANVGGIVGYKGTSNQKIENCTFYGKVRGSADIGTVIGNAVVNVPVNNVLYNGGDNEGIKVIGNGADTAILSNVIGAVFERIINLQVGIDSAKASTISIALGVSDISQIDSIIGNIESDDAITQIDKLVELLANRQTEIGAVQNRLLSVLEEINTKSENLVSMRSTIQDADIAGVSSEYVKVQILQQASATLLATANQTPAIALQLL